MENTVKINLGYVMSMYKCTGCAKLQSELRDARYRTIWESFNVRNFVADGLLNNIKN